MDRRPIPARGPGRSDPGHRARWPGPGRGRGAGDSVVSAFGDVFGWGAVEDEVVVRPAMARGDFGDRVDGVPWSEDEFDTLQIDPRFGVGKGSDGDELAPRAGGGPSSPRRVADPVGWPDE